MLKLSLNLNLLLQWGRTPLIIAALNNFQEIAQLLLKAGASINAQDKVMDRIIPIYVFLYVCMHVCMYVCMYTFMYTLMGEDPSGCWPD